jgi:hypothetical protein
MGEEGVCLHADCDAETVVAAVCDTGQIKHYCDDHGYSRRAGFSLVKEWVDLEGDNE